jgi:hypothetical protein
MLGWLLSDDHLVVAFVIYKWATGYIGKSVITRVLALRYEILHN